MAKLLLHGTITITLRLRNLGLPSSVPFSDKQIDEQKFVVLKTFLSKIESFTVRHTSRIRLARRA